MESRDILTDAYGRIRQSVETAVKALDLESLTFRPEPGANSIAWLVWHLTRVQDDHVSEIADLPQAWVADGWAQRFGMEPDPKHTGFGHTPEQVASVRADAETLLGYHTFVSDRSLKYLATVDGSELDRIIDRSYDPPVSVGVRLVSVISDNIQHAGQARYVRGIVERTLQRR